MADKDPMSAEDRAQLDQAQQNATEWHGRKLASSSSDDATFDSDGYDRAMRAFHELAKALSSKYPGDAGAETAYAQAKSWRDE